MNSLAVRLITLLVACCVGRFAVAKTDESGGVDSRAQSIESLSRSIEIVKDDGGVAEDREAAIAQLRKSLARLAPELASYSAKLGNSELADEIRAGHFKVAQACMITHAIFTLSAGGQTKEIIVPLSDVSSTIRDCASTGNKILNIQPHVPAAVTH